MILYKMCIEPARDKSRMAHYKIPKSKGRLHSCNPVLTYGSDHPGDGLLPATPMNYKLGNHWIIIDRYFHAVFITIVHPDARALWQTIMLDRSDIGQETSRRVFCIHPEFNGMYLNTEIFLLERQCFRSEEHKSELQSILQNSYAD